MTETLTAATPASAWRRQAQEGELYTLPGSGNVARLRRPSLMALLSGAGHVPNPLSDAVLRFMAVADDAKTEAQKLEAYQRNVRVFVEIAKLCMVEPRLAIGRPPDYDAGEIAPDDLHDRDLLFIYYDVCQGPARALTEFRIQPDDGRPAAA
jgi:hypothetical protein